MSISRILYVGQYLLAIVVLFQLKNSHIWGQNRVKKNIDLIEDVHNSRRSDIYPKKYAAPELSWVKYGDEDVDWALLVNAWLCVEDKKGNKSNNKEKELVIYSYQDFNLTEVCRVPPSYLFS